MKIKHESTKYSIGALASALVILVIVLLAGSVMGWDGQGAILVLPLVLIELTLVVAAGILAIAGLKKDTLPCVGVLATCAAIVSIQFGLV